MKRTSLLFLLVSLLISNLIVSSEAKAEETEYQNFIPFVGLGLTSNSSKSDGVIIGDICPSCIGLNSGFGLRENISAGVYNQIYGLWGFDFQYGLSLGYSNRTTKFNKNFFNGYLIRGNEVIHGTSNYVVDAKIMALNATPFINFFPIKGFDLALKLGLSMDFVFSSSASVLETALGNDVYLPGNVKEKQYEEPKINNLNSMLFSLPIGLKYDLFFNNIVVSPEVTYNFGLNKLQNESNWTQNRLYAGVSVAYKIESGKKHKSVVIPEQGTTSQPEEVIAEEKPEEKKEKADIFSRFEWIVNGHRLKSNDTMHIDTFITDYVEELPIIPYVFFEKDLAEVETDIDFTNEEINVLQNPEYIQMKFLALLPDYISQGKVKGLEFSATTDEDPAVLDKRVEFIKKYMEDAGVSLEGIKITKQIIDPNKLKYIELASEYRYMQVDFKGNQLEYISFLSSSTKDFPPLSFTFVSYPQSESEITDTQVEVYSNDKKVAFGTDNLLKIKLSFQEDVVLEYDYTNVLRAKYNVKNADGTVKTFTDSVHLVMDYRVMPDMINARIIRKKDETAGSDHYFEHILAIFDFDRSAVKFVNEKTKEKLYKALEDKDKVEVFGSADSFGTEGYNDNLVKKRVNNALKAVNVSQKNVSIIQREDYTFENSSPIGRMYNRAVMIRIYKDPTGEGKSLDEILKDAGH